MLYFKYNIYVLTPYTTDNTTLYPDTSQTHLHTDSIPVHSNIHFNINIQLK